MNDTPIQIRNPEAVRAIRALARRTGRPITVAVADAVKAELGRYANARDEGYGQRLAAIQEISRRFRELPVVGPELTDEDFYDEDGMPR